ncbi:hypothetical protein RG836_03570 [Pseudomonas sp. SZMC_28357]|uniref:hypothetical protein n=1 Tax=Pseudomonas sp. SZMC_28357 TaxID=3074380 RepID=UPI002871EC09|nr:hypothetical protein [Pseudomonas sp. SZMC_28357]MDR9750512.1 hypothetical protein [Pseudomonas sp. SZMC_28357]
MAASLLKKRIEVYCTADLKRVSGNRGLADRWPGKKWATYRTPFRKLNGLVIGHLPSERTE